LVSDGDKFYLYLEELSIIPNVKIFGINRCLWVNTIVFIAELENQVFTKKKGGKNN